MAANDYKGIWVFAEQQHGHIEPSVFELLAKARELAAHSGEEVTAVLLGCGIASLTEELFARGADAVIAAEHENLEKYSARPYQQALTQLSEKYRPSIILYGATTLGRDLAPRMMVSLNTGLTADAIDLGFDEDGVFYQTTPAYGGKVFANIVIPERRPQMVTVRPRVFEALAPDASRRGCAVFEQVDVLVSPTAPETAFKFGEKTSDPLAMYLYDVATIPANLAGIPGMNIPNGVSSQGLPIGFQVLAPARGDLVMYKVASLVEALSDDVAGQCPAANWEEK